MRRTKGKHREQLTDAQIREVIGKILPVASTWKWEWLASGAFVISFLALSIYLAVYTGLATKTGGRWGLALWIVYLVWMLVAAFGWKRLPEEKLKYLSREQRHRHLRLATIWFFFWTGGYLALASMMWLLLSLSVLIYGALIYLGAMGWVSDLVVGGYLLAFLVSCWQWRRILCLLELWSPETRWGKLMLRLAAIGPAAISIGSVIGLLMGRLHILPKSIACAHVGLLGILIAYVTVPYVVLYFSKAWIHLQIYRAEAKQAAEGIEVSSE